MTVSRIIDIRWEGQPPQGAKDDGRATPMPEFLSRPGWTHSPFVGQARSVADAVTIATEVARQYGEPVMLDRWGTHPEGDYRQQHRTVNPDGTVTPWVWEAPHRTVTIDGLADGRTVRREYVGATMVSERDWSPEDGIS